MLFYSLDYLGWKLLNRPFLLVPPTSPPFPTSRLQLLCGFLRFFASPMSSPILSTFPSPLPLSFTSPLPSPFPCVCLRALVVFFVTRLRPMGLNVLFSSTIVGCLFLRPVAPVVQLITSKLFDVGTRVRISAQSHKVVFFLTKRRKINMSNKWRTND